MVMPLKDSTANNALLESMACGLPSVITDIGATRDYVDNNCCALVSPYDSRGMVETVIDLLDSPKELEMMSNCCRENLKFSWDKVTEQWVKYQAVA
jgi:glycosyltransferase involved in cell wall biosynthesis